MDVKIMMKMSVTAGMIAILLAGCSLPVPREINPPRNAQYITVKGKIPSHTKPSIFAYYESPTCQFKTINMGSGARGKENYKLAKFAEIDFNEKTGEFSAKLPIDGGTRCQWNLNSFKIGIKYIDTTELLGSNVHSSSTGSLSINLLPKCVDNSTIFKNKLAIFSKFYPLQYIDTKKNKNNLRIVNIKSTHRLGNYVEKYSLDITDNKNGEVYFYPTIDDKYIVKQIDDDKSMRVEYPNGTVINNEIYVKPYPKDKRDQSLKEQKRLQESMGIFPIDTSKNPDACKNL